MMHDTVADKLVERDSPNEIANELVRLAAIRANEEDQTDLRIVRSLWSHSQPHVDVELVDVDHQDRPVVLRLVRNLVLRLIDESDSVPEKIHITVTAENERESEK